MSLMLRHYRLEDERAFNKLKDEAYSCLKYIVNRSMAKYLWIVESSYAEKVWTNGSLVESRDCDSASSIIEFKQPIGIVLEGALEVTERFSFNNIIRERTTAIIPAGGFFGLFEAFGNFIGRWDISAGIRRFLIASSIGNNINQISEGIHFDRKQLLTFTHDVRADYDYAGMITSFKSLCENLGILAQPWKCRFALIDRISIEDEGILRLLLEVTVKQLSSWIRQNPPDVLFSKLPRTKDTAERMRVGATIDAILSGDIPVWSAYREDHNNYGPFRQISDIIIALDNQGLVQKPRIKKSKPPTRLLVPEYWPNVRPPGAVYIDALAKKFQMSIADSLLGKELDTPISLRSGTKIESLIPSEGRQYSCKVITENGQEVQIHRLSAKHGERHVSGAFNKNSSPRESLNDFISELPSHLCNGIYFKA